MPKSLIVFFLLSHSVLALGAACKIDMEDINKKLKKSFKIDTSKKKSPSKHNFSLPNSDYSCTLAFFDLDSGTMLSCEFNKDMGQTFFQSDRSVVKEHNPVNNLSFRHLNSQIYIESSCQ
ncbi:MAG: hypothetical protein HQK52_16910 [Oligoflexia bacterium]|nr:hypothetical protein [Oligoflexia bacterium]